MKNEIKNTCQKVCTNARCMVFSVHGKTLFNLALIAMLTWEMARQNINEIEMSIIISSVGRVIIAFQ
jgi:hypothetical protein